MDLALTETQQLIVKTARDYAERVVRPVAAALDRGDHRLGHIARVGDLAAAGQDRRNPAAQEILHQASGG